eukprot:4959810-Amphidinium_carterae.4
MCGVRVYKESSSTAVLTIPGNGFAQRKVSHCKKVKKVPGNNAHSYTACYESWRHGELESFSERAIPPIGTCLDDMERKRSDNFARSETVGAEECQMSFADCHRREWRKNERRFTADVRSGHPPIPPQNERNRHQGKDLQCMLTL